MVRYYSVVFEGEDSISEVADFLARHRTVEYLEEMKPLYALLKSMAFMHGAKADFFRNEREALALPPDWRGASAVPREIRESFKEVGNLRLYVVRLNEHVVFLLNGGEKTERWPQDCPNVRKYFLQAQKIAQAIDEAMKDGEIWYNDQKTDILFKPNFELCIP